MRYNRTIEEYVEIIWDLLRDSPVARVKDIASARGVTRPTVTSVLEKLKHNDLVEHENYGFVTLTPKGRKLAVKLNSIHQTFKKLFVKVLGVDETIAENDACKLEHYISPDTQFALLKFLNFLEHCPLGAEKMLKLYHNCFLYTNELDKCSECSTEVVENLREIMKVFWEEAENKEDR